jgi:hypothetical protein
LIETFVAEALRRHPMPERKFSEAT